MLSRALRRIALPSVMFLIATVPTSARDVLTGPTLTMDPNGVTPLAGVVALQLMLGVEAWMMQLAAGTLPEMLPLTTGRVAVRTAHVLGGSLVFALAVVVALLAGRRLAPLAQAVPDGRLEEAA